MSDTSENSEDKGFRINSHGLSCIPCRCKRQFYHKETKTVQEENKTTTNIIVDKRNTKFGSTGRHTSPDDIFKQDDKIQTGSVAICDTGWGKTQITPEECEERLDKIEETLKGLIKMLKK